MSSPGGTHECPGGCGRQVLNVMFACKADWFRLPHALRSAIWAAWNDGDGAAHAHAMSEAALWYGVNPRQAPVPVRRPQSRQSRLF